LASFDPERFDEDVRQGHMVGTNGPVIVATLGGEGPGLKPFQPRSGATLNLEVRAAPWIPVTEVRVVVNGTVVRTIGGNNLRKPSNPFGKDGIVRFAGSLPLEDLLARVPADKDAWIVVEAGLPPVPARDLDPDGRPDTTDTNHDGVIDERDRLGRDDDETWEEPGRPRARTLGDGVHEPLARRPQGGRLDRPGARTVSRGGTRAEALAAGRAGVVERRELAAVRAAGHAHGGGPPPRGERADGEREHGQADLRAAGEQRGAEVRQRGVVVGHAGQSVRRGGRGRGRQRALWGGRGEEPIAEGLHPRAEVVGVQPALHEGGIADGRVGPEPGQRPPKEGEASSPDIVEHTELVHPHPQVDSFEHLFEEEPDTILASYDHFSEGPRRAFDPVVERQAPHDVPLVLHAQGTEPHLHAEGERLVEQQVGGVVLAQMIPDVLDPRGWTLRQWWRCRSE
jgi:hypothetical protein